MELLQRPHTFLDLADDDQLLSDYLSWARISPGLDYDLELAKKLAIQPGPLGELIETYFKHQPDSYRQELRAVEALNTPNSNQLKHPSIFVIVPCFSEDDNFENYISLFQKQIGPDGRTLPPGTFELVFIVNCPDNTADYNRLVRGCEKLIRLKHNHRFIHILPKIFRPEHACLGRARKYGIDYCNQRISTVRQSIDPRRIGHYDHSCFIVCCEGDTLSIPSDYLNQYRKYFDRGNERLVQGKIEYPELCQKFGPLNVFCKAREATVKGLGANQEYFSQFGGLMPVGRNMALGPWISLRVGGIDPIRRPGTDDDINFGVDIARFIGEQVKQNSNVTLITSPRREVLIVSDICRGHNTNMKSSYQKFHEFPALYDLDNADLIRIASSEIPAKTDHKLNCKLLQQMYQWIISLCLREQLHQLPEAIEIIAQYRGHSLGYWEKEEMLWRAFNNRLEQIALAQHQKLANKAATEALQFLNSFVYELGIKFARTDTGIYSELQ